MPNSDALKEIRERLDELGGIQDYNRRLIASMEPYSAIIREALKYQTFNTSIFQSVLQPLHQSFKIDTSPLIAMAEQQREWEQRIALITKPLNELLSVRLPAINIPPSITESLRALNEQFSTHRALFEALKSPIIDTGLSRFSVSSFLALQHEENLLLGETEPPPDADTIRVAANETLLAGNVATIVSNGRVISEVEVRVITTISAIDELFCSALPRIRPGLLEKWRGARDTIATANPDRAAILCYELRELIKGTLNGLVAKNEPEFFSWVAVHGGKPTLALKAKFLVARTRLALRFAERDAEEVIQLLDHFNVDGVHNDNPEQGDAEMRALLRRVEGFLAYLIELAYPAG